MADDIVTERVSHLDGCSCLVCLMGQEIKRLRTALALAVGEMSTSGEYSYLSPETLLNKFLEEARRG